MAKTSNSLTEKLRMPVSRLFAGAFLLLAIFTIPKGFGDGLHQTFEMLGYVMLIVAALGRVWCSIYISGRKDKELCVIGPYSLCRNPLYYFSFLGVAGAFLGLQSILMSIVASLVFLIYYRSVILGEEKRLLKMFGGDFETYMKSTPRFFLSFAHYTRSEATMTTTPKVIERGLTEVFWFLMAIVIIDLLEYIHTQGWLVYYTLPF